MNKQKIITKLFEQIQTDSLFVIRNKTFALDEPFVDEWERGTLYLSDRKPEDFRIAFFNGEMFMMVDSFRNSGDSFMHFYVIEREDEMLIAYEVSPIGIAYRVENKICELGNIWVGEKFLGLGIGTYGLKFLEEKAAARGVRRIEGIYSPCRSSQYMEEVQGKEQPRAEKMYRQNGYTIHERTHNWLVQKEITWEVAAEINANSESMEGVQVYNPLDEWIRISDRGQNDE